MDVWESDFREGAGRKPQASRAAAGFEGHGRSMAYGKFGSGSGPLAEAGVAASSASGGPLTEGDILAIGEGLIARSLPRERWTHGAHLVAAVYVLMRRRDLVAERDMPGLIKGYNAAIGLVDAAARGYHETITQFYLAAIRHFILHRSAGQSLAAVCNALIASPFGARDFVSTYYSHETLFSPEARRGFVAPDLRPLAFDDIPVARGAAGGAPERLAGEPG